MKAYKGFDKSLKCRGYQYEIGKAYDEPEANLCKNGFHACERPLDVFSYYPPSNSRYCEVDLEEVSSERNSDSKVCAKKIKVGAEVGIAELVEAQIKYVKEHTTTEHTDPKLETAGNYGVATAGYSGAATAGKCGAATAGKCGAATAKGSSSVGMDGIASSRGKNAKVRGGLGAVLVCAVEHDDSYKIKTWACGVVDGDKIKPNTWYTVEDGDFVEVPEGREDDE